MADITIVVPVYNVEKYIERCINSLVHQTIELERIILVDDGSTDSSGAICDDFANNYNNISVVHQKNQGLSAARNKGIEMAETEYIGFVDSDDYVDPDMYAELFKLITDNTADISVCGVWVEKENGDKYSKYGNNGNIIMDNKKALIELNSYKLFNMSFCDKLFKKNLFDDIRFPVGKLCEDYYIMHKIIAKTDKLAYTSKEYYHYIQRQISISRNKNINLAPMEASTVQTEFYRQNFPDIAFVAETACAFSHMGIYSAYIRNGIKCPKDLLKKCTKISKKYLCSVLKNPYIPKIKKLQAVTFCYCKPAYKNIIKRREHR